MILTYGLLFFLFWNGTGFLPSTYRCSNILTMIDGFVIRLVTRAQNNYLNFINKKNMGHRVWVLERRIRLHSVMSVGWLMTRFFDINIIVIIKLR